MSDRQNQTDRSTPDTGRRDGELPPDSGDIADDAERTDTATPLPHSDDNIGRPGPAR